MTWRIYSESMNPGRDWRLNGASDTTIVAPDHVYPANSPVGAIGNAGAVLRCRRPYATKHNGSVIFQDVRSAPDFVGSNRTMGGGQWDDALLGARARPPAGTSISSARICERRRRQPELSGARPVRRHARHDRHRDRSPGTDADRPASDCGGNANIYRGDLYTDYLIKKIQASPIWTNTNKRVAIVIMFDEGTATTGFNSCCGWNPAGKPTQRRRPAARPARQQRRRRSRPIDDRQLRKRQQGTRHQHLRHPHQPALRAEGRRRQRRLQPHLVRAHAAGHVRPGRSGRRLVIHEPFEVHRAVHPDQPRQPA